MYQIKRRVAPVHSRVKLVVNWKLFSHEHLKYMNNFNAQIKHVSYCKDNYFRIVQGIDGVVCEDLSGIPWLRCSLIGGRWFIQKIIHDA